jgi:hypothetical protein
LHHRLFIQDVHGGTLVFSRRCWEQLARYPDYSLAEDAGFLYQAVQRGARLCRLVNASLFIYLRHADNSWSFNCGEYLDPQGWQRVAEPPLLPEDRAFYAVHSPAAPTLSPSRPSSPGVAEPPLVSCIMPTVGPLCRKQYGIFCDRTIAIANSSFWMTVRMPSRI